MSTTTCLVSARLSIVTIAVERPYATRGVSGGAQALATGSADGKVQLWTPSLEMAVCIDVKALGPLSHMIHSLSWDGINHKVEFCRHDSPKRFRVMSIVGYTNANTLIYFPVLFDDIKLIKFRRYLACGPLPVRPVVFYYIYIWRRLRYVSPAYPIRLIACTDARDYRQLRDLRSAGF